MHNALSFVYLVHCLFPFSFFFKKEYHGLQAKLNLAKSCLELPVLCLYLSKAEIKIMCHHTDSFCLHMSVYIPGLSTKIKKMSSRFIHVVSGSSPKIFKSNVYIYMIKYKNTIYINMMLWMRILYIFFLSSNSQYLKFFYTFDIWNFELSLVVRACNILSG